MKKLLLLTISLGLFIACGQDAQTEEAAAIKVENISLGNDKYYDKKDAKMDSPKPKMDEENNTKIIKTANLKFETKDLTASYKTVQKATHKYGAIIANDNSGKDFASSNRNLVIRLPNKYFDKFINDISKGVSHFDVKEIAQEDVTETYIDTESRMLSKKKLEQRYLQLLSKANKVSEMLEIEEKLSEIREEIEAKEGQLKYLQNRITMSTISIEMYTLDPDESGATDSYGGKIWNSLKEGFNGLSNFMLSIISNWPFILIFVLVYLWIRKRFFKKKTT